MTHACLVSGKYAEVIYSDNNEQLVALFRDAVHGKYNYNVFTPEFITREEFFKRKDKDAYIRWLWSFGSAGEGYIYSRKIEQLKHEAHDFIVFNRRSAFIDDLMGKDFILPDADIRTRRLFFRSTLTKNKKRFDLPHLERFEWLERIEGLERIESLNGLYAFAPVLQIENLERIERLEGLETLKGTGKKLTIQCRSYTEYEYAEGDVVYCDPPYEDKYKRNYYSCGFDFEKFLDWTASRSYPVYFSSYPLSDELNKGRFELLWHKDTFSTLSPTSNSTERTECLYRSR